MYERLEEYIFKIFSHEEGNINKEETDFRLFVPGKKSKKFGGKIYDEDGQEEDTYFVVKDDEKFGIKIGDGRYIYGQSRKKMVESPEFKDIISNDEYIDEEEFKEKFKDAEYVEVFEYDREEQNTFKLSYLVNGDIFLLIKYFDIYEDDDSLKISIRSDILDSDFLEMFNFDKKIDKKKINLTNASLIISDNHQLLFDIVYNEKSVVNSNPRIRLIKKVYYDILETENIFDYIQGDVETCYNSMLENLRGKFGDEISDER